ncbi:MAG: class I SAM-dependent methyltransferase [Candidatus Buchananbacteria bacterium]
MNNQPEIFQKKYWEREKLNSRRSPNHAVVFSFANSKINEIKKVITLDQTTTLLDVGAGNGFFSYPFAKICQVTAIDYSEKMIELNPAKTKMVMDANYLNFTDDSFDVVFESCMLHHVKDCDKIIDEMIRISKEYIVIIEPNRNNPLTFMFGLLNKEERKSLRFSLNYLKKKLKNHNLKILSAFSHGAIAPNKVPEILLPIFEKIDKKIPIFGLDNVIICKK